MNNPATITTVQQQTAMGVTDAIFLGLGVAFFEMPSLLHLLGFMNGDE